MKIKISKSQWEKMGREAGWMDAFKMMADPVLKPLKKALEPDRGDIIRNYDDSGRTFDVSNILTEQEVMSKGSKDVSIESIFNQFQKANDTDPAFLKAFPRAIEFVKKPPSFASPETVGGLKVLLYRILNLEKNNPKRKQFVDILKKWYENRRIMDGV